MVPELLKWHLSKIQAFHTTSLERKNEGHIKQKENAKMQL